MSLKISAKVSPSSLVRRFLAVPRMNRFLGVMAVYYVTAFWVEPFGLSGSMKPSVMGASVVAFWFLTVMAFFVLPAHPRLGNGRLIQFRGFVLSELADIPYFRPNAAVGRNPPAHAVIAVGLVLVPLFLITMKLVASANPVCTVVAAAALLTLLKGDGAQARAERAAKKYELGSVVLAEFHYEQGETSKTRPAIVASHFGPWLVLIPFTSQDKSGRPDYVRFDQSDWRGANRPESYAHLLKVQLAKPEQIMDEAGWVTETGWRKFTEASARVPVQVRHKMRSALETWTPRFDDEEAAIKIPVTFGDEEAMRTIENLYCKHAAVRSQRRLHALAAAFSLTLLWIALHKVGLVALALKTLDHKGTGETVDTVTALSWKTGLLWSMFVGVASRAAVRDIVEKHWQRLSQTARRIVTAVFVGWLMSLTTAPSLTSVAIFVIFGGATYSALVLRLFRIFSAPSNVAEAAADLGISLDSGGYLSEDPAHIFNRMNQDRFGANRAGRDATWNRGRDRQFD